MSLKPAVRFTVPGPVPSKSNYRKDGSESSRAAWRRIKRYEDEVGWWATVAGAKALRSRGEPAGCKAKLELVLVNQDVDLDNALKCPIDGLKTVAFEDDSPEHLDRVQVLWREDLEDPKPRVEYTISWGGE